MAKYKYINENVLNEFLGRILKSLAGKSGKKAASLLKADPEMQKLMKKGDDLADKMRKQIQKNKKLVEFELLKLPLLDFLYRFQIL